MKPELVKKIKSQFGLNIYETKVWLALLSKGIASAGEIAKISEIPRSRTYDVLESLEKMGFAISKIGKPVKYIAVKPNLVIEKIKRDEMQKVSEKIDVLSNIKDTAEYKELESLFNTKTQLINKNEFSGTINGRLNLNSHILELVEDAKKEISICMPASFVSEKARVFSNLLKKAKESGIKLNIALSGSAEEIKKINEKFSIKAKQTNIDAFFFIKDSNEILFMLDKNTGENQSAIWLNSDFFVPAISNLFKTAVK